ncbi:VWA domain-containing protein [Nitratireductor sp. CAU 1489]|uniref:VWA domain-containing protein n=1 Tax=Nitratireductor arenosus TaxID=2682096 RepID=A0A844QEA8_9HYPH|nr:pilus assembly protein [Nitratireductor arenosus]MVA96321.1 VWA domain-containing protein [Nitratireductor arenosus]
MRARTGFCSRLREFRSDRSGNFALATAAVASALVAGGGFAMNLAQITLTRSNLSNALDSAVTSTARDLTTGKVAPDDVDALVLAFVKANGSTGFANQDRITLDRVTIDRQARTVSAVASTEIDLAFPVFKASASRLIQVESTALYSDRKIEVAMMLDITGSMSGRKLRDLQAAASNVVDTFLSGQNATDPRVRLAIVPYADAVNTGVLAPVVHVEAGFTTGEPPVLEDNGFVSASLRKTGLLLDGSRRPDSCATERKGAQQFTDASPRKAMVNRDYRLAFCPSAALEPLTADASRLKATIGAFRASGHTAGHIGIQWSWYMLSRKWADVLPAGSRPLASNAKKVGKFAILMTDGEFNTAFAGVPRGGTTKGGQSRRSRNQAERLCEEMKKQGIEIFTVGFQLRERNAKQVMQACASPDRGSIQHYFEAASGQELDAAFQEIASNIERLAIIK